MRLEYIVAIVAIVVVVVCMVAFAAAIVMKQRRDAARDETLRAIEKDSAKQRQLSQQIEDLQKQQLELQALAANYTLSGDTNAAAIAQASIDSLIASLGALNDSRTEVNRQLYANSTASLNDTTNTITGVSNEITAIQAGGNISAADAAKIAELKAALADLEKQAQELAATKKIVAGQLGIVQPACGGTSCVSGTLDLSLCTCKCTGGYSGNLCSVPPPTAVTPISPQVQPPTTINCVAGCPSGQVQNTTDCSCKCAVGCPQMMIQNPTDCSCRCAPGTVFDSRTGKCVNDAAPLITCPNTCASDQTRLADCSCKCMTACPGNQIQALDCSCSCPAGTYWNASKGLCEKIGGTVPPVTTCVTGCPVGQTQLADCGCICNQGCPAGQQQSPTDCTCKCPLGTVYDAAKRQCVPITSNDITCSACGANEFPSGPPNCVCDCINGYIRDTAGKCVVPPPPTDCDGGWLGYPACTTRDPAIYPVENNPELVKFLCDNRVVYGGGADSQSPNMGTATKPWYFNIYYNPKVEQWFSDDPTRGWFIYDRSIKDTYDYCKKYNAAM